MILTLLAFYTKYSKLIIVSIFSILLLIIGLLCFKIYYVENLYTTYKHQVELDKKDIEIQNNILLRQQAEKLNNAVTEFNNNQKRKEDEIQDLKNLITKSNSQSISLYKAFDNKIAGISSNTSNETLLRYINVLDKSYRETNEAYGEAGESLERSKIELNKCISDIDVIYKMNENIK